MPVRHTQLSSQRAKLKQPDVRGADRCKYFQTPISAQSNRRACPCKTLNIDKRLRQNDIEIDDSILSVVPMRIRQASARRSLVPDALNAANSSSNTSFNASTNLNTSVGRHSAGSSSGYDSGGGGQLPQPEQPVIALRTATRFGSLPNIHHQPSQRSKTGSKRSRTSFLSPTPVTSSVGSLSAVSAGALASKTGRQRNVSNVTLLRRARRSQSSGRMSDSASKQPVTVTKPFKLTNNGLPDRRCVMILQQEQEKLQMQQKLEHLHSKYQNMVRSGNFLAGLRRPQLVERACSPLKSSRPPPTPTNDKPETTKPQMTSRATSPQPAQPPDVSSCEQQTEDEPVAAANTPTPSARDIDLEESMPDSSHSQQASCREEQTQSAMEPCVRQSGPEPLLDHTEEAADSAEARLDASVARFVASAVQTSVQCVAKQRALEQLSASSRVPLPAHYIATQNDVANYLLKHLFPAAAKMAEAEQQE